MTRTTSLRKALLAGGTLAAAMWVANLSAAQEMPPSAPSAAREPQAIAAGDVPLDDPNAALRSASIAVRASPERRFAPSRTENRRGVEVEVAAGDDDLSVSFAQRASLGADANGDLNRQGRGSEVRIGQGLVRERAQGEGASTYVFVASDNEAITWQPGARSEMGAPASALARQDRVEVGDLSAGVTFERNGVQASVAYVEREEQATIGTQSFSQDESFTGVTVTMRR